MTEKERLAKNTRIRERGKQTREKRKKQVCRVYRVKIDISHLNEARKTHLKMLFVEAKWLCNDALTFMNDHDISEYDAKTQTVHGLDKDKLPVTHDLLYLGSQMKQSVIHGIKYSIKGLATLRRKKCSSNRYKARKLLQRAYQRLTSRKRDVASKIVHELLEHERLYMQDENISGWHKGFFGGHCSIQC